MLCGCFGEKPAEFAAASLLAGFIFMCMLILQPTAIVPFAHSQPVIPSHLDYTALTYIYIYLQSNFMTVMSTTRGTFGIWFEAASQMDLLRYASSIKLLVQTKYFLLLRSA